MNASFDFSELQAMGFRSPQEHLDEMTEKLQPICGKVMALMARLSNENPGQRQYTFKFEGQIRTLALETIKAKFVHAFSCTATFSSDQLFTEIQLVNEWIRDGQAKFNVRHKDICEEHAPEECLLYAFY